MAKKKETFVFELKRGFLQGLEFELAHLWIQSRGSQNMKLGKSPGPVIAGAVNSAFSAEIYLKCLQLIDHGNAESGHSLRALFDRLTPDTRKLVRDYYDEYIAGFDVGKMTKEMGVPFDLDTVLTNASDAFIDWRYHFEERKPRTWSGPIIKVACRLAIVKLRPELKKYEVILDA